MSMVLRHREINAVTGKEVKVYYDTISKRYVVKPVETDIETWIEEDTEREALNTAREEAGTIVPGVTYIAKFG